MRKVIIVENCDEIPEPCPFYTHKLGRSFCKKKYKYFTTDDNAHFIDPYYIPSWCPLEDDIINNLDKVKD